MMEEPEQPEGGEDAPRDSEAPGPEIEGLEELDQAAPVGSGGHHPVPSH